MICFLVGTGCRDPVLFVTKTREQRQRNRMGLWKCMQGILFASNSNEGTVPMIFVA
jgi:hypothetical protein